MKIQTLLQRHRTALLVFGLLLSIYTRPVAAAPFTFDSYEVTTGSAVRQTMLTGFLLGGAVADLVALHIDEHGNRRLRVFAFNDSTWVLHLDETLRREVSFVDIAHIDGFDRLLIYEPGRLNWFDPTSATQHLLHASPCNFNPPRQGEIPHVDITHDLNGDGRDDLVMPDIDGFWLFVQTADGTFADPVKIGPATEMDRIYGADGYRYDPWSQSRVHAIDYNQDGHRDLAFWNGNHFEVHLQSEHGLFNPATETFTSTVKFDADQLSSLTTGDMVGKVLHSLSDLNGDNIADLVLFSLAGKGIANKHSAYEVHFGTPTPDGGIAFAPEVGAAFRSDGDIRFGMERHDFEGDGQVDLMFTGIDLDFLEYSLWKSIKGFMGDDIWLNLEFYQQGNLDSDKPNAIRRMQLDGHPSTSEPGWVPLDIVLRGRTHESRKTQRDYPRAFNTTLLIGDVTGDGRSDLLIEWTHRELHVYAGVPGPELFAQKPQKIAVAIPNDEEYTWLVDLNKDGVQDLLMHHPHRVVTLFAR